jgi:hypothetical protein
MSRIGDVHSVEASARGDISGITADHHVLNVPFKELGSPNFPEGGGSRYI